MLLTLKKIYILKIEKSKIETFCKLMTLQINKTLYQ